MSWIEKSRKINKRGGGGGMIVQDSRVYSQVANEKKWEQLQLTLDNSNSKKDNAMKQICSRK